MKAASRPHGRTLLLLVAAALCPAAHGQDLSPLRDAATAAGVKQSHFETRNVLWEDGPVDAAGRSSGSKAMHFYAGSHVPGQKYMSTSWFPEYNLQIKDLTQLKFDMLVPAGSTCGARVSVVLNGVGLGTSTTDGKQVLIYPDHSASCPANTWFTEDLLHGFNVRWAAGSIGGGSGETQSSAHALAFALDPAYRVAVVRINYDDGSSAAWFDNEFVNGAHLQGALDDTAYPQAAAAGAPAAVAPPPYGYYQTRNILWEDGAADASGKTSGAKAMHYYKASHPAAQPYMSTSFFPQYKLQIKDLVKLQFDMMVPPTSACGGGSPRMVIVLNGANLGTTSTDGKQIVLYGPHTYGCPTNTWLTEDFIHDAVGWNASSIGGGSGESQGSAHALAASVDPAYRIAVIRINYDSGGNEAWFDNQYVNTFKLMGAIDDTSYPQNTAAGSAPAAAYGFYESRNVKWQDAPSDATGRSSGAKAMHDFAGSHAAADTFMSTSFFPQHNMQIPDLQKMQFDMLVPTGSSCARGPFMEVVLEGAGLGAGSTGSGILVYGAHALGCPVNTWFTEDLVGGPGVRWAAQAIGGGPAETQASAHARAVALDPAYRISVVRMGYYHNTPANEAWVDNEFINTFKLQGALDDTTYLKSLGQ